MRVHYPFYAVSPLAIIINKTSWDMRTCTFDLIDYVII